MHLKRISISNFRAINFLELDTHSNAVVLAGPNGCGKSCILDAIRLLKSAFGGYQRDEWNTWFGEFQINLQNAEELLPVFRNKSLPICIFGDFVLSGDELTYLRDNAVALLEEKAHRDISQIAAGWRKRQSISLASQQRNQQSVVEYSNEMMLEFTRLLDSSEQRAELRIDPTSGATVTENLLLEVLFSTYQPQDLGIIDYHGPHRNYSRERLGNISLTIESAEQRLRDHALYNYTNKYANLKSEMASAYIRHLIARQAVPDAPLDDSLTATLKELFSTFFPGKQFLGPRSTADGRLLFPVLVADGTEHDIDDLSSGEKEVLYGYLRLQNAAPRRSIILIDEPELHLNPRLVSGLAAFYYRHLGSRLENQLWLVTHSDTLIREAVDQPGFTVFHIHPHTSENESQATIVKAQQELEKVVLALVGDLAAYRPGAKVVVFESTADSAFDVKMTSTLFPEFAQRINLISGGNKRRVLELYEILERSHAAGHFPDRFFAITDADDGEERRPPGNHFQWDVYHIENYLLNPLYILEALRAVGINADSVGDQSHVLELLKQCAKESINSLVAHQLRERVNRELVSTINLSFDQSRSDVGVALAESVARSNKKFCEKIAKITAETLTKNQSNIVVELNKALEDGTWQKRFRGRDILRRFAGKVVKGMEYEYFRDLVISRMSERNYKPPGMSTVVEAILAA